MSDSLLKEVDNAVKRQRLEDLWQTSGRQIILFVALFAISVIALLLYKQHQRTQQEAQSDALLRGLAAYEATQQPMHTDTLTGTFKQIGSLLKAAQLWQAGNSEESQKMLSDAHTAQDGNALLNDYACLMQQLSSAKQSADCHADSVFKDLLLEPRIMHQLQADGINAAYDLLPPAPPEDAGRLAQAPRIGMLRAYLRSHSDTVDAQANETSENGNVTTVPGQ